MLPSFISDRSLTPWSFHWNWTKAIPIKCFVSHRPTDPFLWKSKKKKVKKKKIPESLVKKQVLWFTSTRSCLSNTNCLKLSSILRFCSLFRHLIVLLIYIFYHLIISCRLNVRFNMQSCVHSFFFARPTDPPSREGGQWETKHFMGIRPN